MNVKDEIEKYAKEEDKPALRWLFERNHWSSQWHYVADCRFGERGLHAPRIWFPKPAGRAMFEADLIKRRLQIVQDFLRELIAGEDLYRQTLRDKACLLATEFNPNDFVKKEATHDT